MIEIAGLVITKNGEKHLDLILEQFKRINVAEIVVCVNDTTTDASVDIANKYTDKVHLLDFKGVLFAETILNEAYDKCSCEWILRIDDDELVSTQFTDLHEKLHITAANGIWFPRYHSLYDTRHYINTEPWYPDYQMRLFRKTALVPHSGKVHITQEVKGNQEEHWDDHPIFHMTYLWRTLEERERRIVEYDNSRYSEREAQILNKLQVFENHKMVVADCSVQPLVSMEAKIEND